MNPKVRTVPIFLHSNPRLWESPEWVRSPNPPWALQSFNFQPNYVRLAFLPAFGVFVPEKLHPANLQWTQDASKKSPNVSACLGGPYKENLRGLRGGRASVRACVVSGGWGVGGCWAGGGGYGVGTSVLKHQHPTDCILLLF